MVKTMTVKQLIDLSGFEAVSLPDPDKQVCGAYAGDLLSWVMGRAESNSAWVTIMTNINVLAVASLIDLSCVIVCEDSEMTNKFIEEATAKSINIIKTSNPVYEACVILGKIL